MDWSIDPGFRRDWTGKPGIRRDLTGESDFSISRRQREEGDFEILRIRYVSKTKAATIYTIHRTEEAFISETERRGKKLG